MFRNYQESKHSSIQVRNRNMYIQHPLNMRHRITNRQDNIRVMIHTSNLKHTPSYRHVPYANQVNQDKDLFTISSRLRIGHTTTNQVRHSLIHRNPLHMRHRQDNSQDIRQMRLNTIHINNPTSRLMTIFHQHNQLTHRAARFRNLHTRQQTTPHVRNRTNHNRKVHMRNQITTWSPRFHHTNVVIANLRISCKFKGLTVIIITVLTHPQQTTIASSRPEITCTLTNLQRHMFHRLTRVIIPIRQHNRAANTFLMPTPRVPTLPNIKLRIMVLMSTINAMVIRFSNRNFQILSIIQLQHNNQQHLL